MIAGINPFSSNFKLSISIFIHLKYALTREMTHGDGLIVSFFHKLIFQFKIQKLPLNHILTGIPFPSRYSTSSMVASPMQLRKNTSAPSVFNSLALR